MADAPIYGPPPLPPADVYTGATFEQILFGVTGLGVDMHRLNEQADWFVPLTGDAMAAATAGSYTAWGTVYFGVSYNVAALDDWDRAITENGTYVDAFAKGRAGLLDTQALWNARQAIVHYQNWLLARDVELQGWIQALDSGDSAFQGRAAIAVRDRLREIRFTLADITAQLTTRRTPPPVPALDNVEAKISAYGRALDTTWASSDPLLRDSVRIAMRYVTDSVHAYLRGQGLVEGTPNYSLDQFGDQPSGDAFVLERLAAFDSLTTQGRSVSGPWQYEVPPLPPGMRPIAGDLTSPATWATINQAVTDFVRPVLTALDEQARVMYPEVEQAYHDTEGPLATVVPVRDLAATREGPPPEGAGGPVDFGDGNSGSGQPPQFGTTAVTSEPPPDSFTNAPADIPDGPLAEGALGASAPPGGPDASDPFAANDFSFADGDFASGSFGSGELSPDFAEQSGVAEPFEPNGVGSPNQSPGTAAPPVLIPPVAAGGMANGSANVGPPPGLGVRSAGGVRTVPGDATGKPDGTSGAGRLPGFGVTGEGWADWSGQETADDGVVRPDTASPEKDSRAGMPMFPPMVPPVLGGPGGGDAEERERQSWLAEDGKVWGAGTGAGGVIGRPVDGRPEADEPKVLAHVHVRPVDSPRRTRRSTQDTESADSAGA